MSDKAALRKELRKLRASHAATIPGSIKGLIFRHPPAPLLSLIPSSGPSPSETTIGLYHAAAGEAPASGYAKYFLEAGHTIALPRFASADSPMEVALHSDPFDETDLEDGPFGIKMPTKDAAGLIPDVLFVPLLGFTESGGRLGQGGGHYDRFLSNHTKIIAIGMAWDCQLTPQLPLEPHDMPMTAIVTPTRFYGPF